MARSVSRHCGMNPTSGPSALQALVITVHQVVVQLDRLSEILPAVFEDCRDVRRNPLALLALLYRHGFDAIMPAGVGFENSPRHHSGHGRMRPLRIRAKSPLAASTAA